MTLAILLLVVAMFVSFVIVGIVKAISVLHMKKSVKSAPNSNITAQKGPQIDDVKNMHKRCGCAANTIQYHNTK